MFFKACERGKGEGSCKKEELEIGNVSHLNEFEEIRAVKNTHELEL